ncbi:MAG TPA: hypothetical protein VFB36_09310 [Nevskiaceae bacterium]|nr:hypothetical protein [Nevskiaceae bacterium]
MRCFGLVVTALLLGGCAHPMVITPDIARVNPDPAQQRVHKNAGFYISPQDRAAEVTTPGGGGDKVRYRPYADLETGLYRMLSNVFDDVTRLNAPDDAAAIAQHQISYVILPKVSTDSSSNGVFTWMATDFTVGLTCDVRDPAGKPVTQVSVTGTGKAAFSNLTANPSYAGQRASEDALIKMQRALADSPQLKK